jgi:hypothetical protein
MKLRILIAALLLCAGNVSGKSIAFTFTDQAWLGMQLRAPAASGNILTDLHGNWTMDEASGQTRVDTMSTNDLANSGNSVLSVVGVVSNAASFDGTSAWLNHASNSELAFTNQSFTMSLFVLLTNKSDSQFIVGKWGASGADYVLWYFVTSDRFQFIRIDDTGSSSQFVNAESFGSPSVNTPYFIICGQSIADDQIFISVNNGTTDTQSMFGNLGWSGPAAFTIGQFDGGGSQLTGYVDQLDLWARLLTADEKTRMYNSGSGRDPVTNP